MSLQRVVILDGGMATELERRGAVLDSRLWSAALLVDDPAAIGAVHRDYLEAGADCIVSASYQATFEGFAAMGLSESEAERALRRSVETARAARDDVWRWEEGESHRQKPLVAAGIGPYGAYLADGSEYTGDYDLDESRLVAFHRRRWQVLAEAGADLLACETIPSAAEARSLARLLEETPGIRAWISFSCRDGERISDGTELAAIVRELGATPGLVAVGVNCTSPRFISSLLRRAAVETDKPLVAYPNSGEAWDAAHRCWVAEAPPVGLAQAAGEWVGLGARLIGGCCRTTPADIRVLRETLLESA